MTAMLASVRSLSEARRAVAVGVDVVDCKDPTLGALGALALPVIRAIARELGAETCTSAAAGELDADPATLEAMVLPIAAVGVDFVKIGLPVDVDGSAWARALGQLAAGGVRVVAVLFADRRAPLDLLPELAAAGVKGIMLDTAEKSSAGLRSRMPLRELSKFVDQAKALGLLTGLAGSLRAADVPGLLALEPDYLGFRGALCGSEGRHTELDRDATRRVRRLIPITDQYPETAPVGHLVLRQCHIDGVPGA